MFFLVYLSYLRGSDSLLRRELISNLPFSLEAFARICVSGFLLDPEIPLSSIFSSPFADYPEVPTITPSTNQSPPLVRQGSLTHTQGPLSRGLSITQRLSRLRRNIIRPYTLPVRPNTSSHLHDVTLPPTTASKPQTVTEKVITIAQSAHSAIRDPPQPTFFSKALRSDHADALSLPFRLSITNIHDKTHRNLPYLRNSWSRIDFVAIISYWISFFLATAGLERGAQHIGVFRAMSVVRTARLLTITSGTTVRFPIPFVECLGC